MRCVEWTVVLRFGRRRQRWLNELCRTCIALAFEFEMRCLDKTMAETEEDKDADGVEDSERAVY